MAMYNGFRPQQGLLIMNSKRIYIVLENEGSWSFRPQQGLLIMNMFLVMSVVVKEIAFPSPTGVTYYELTARNARHHQDRLSFRPQQGLLIMN